MGLLNLIGDISGSGFGQGLTNYFGNDTAMGQDINKMGNIWQMMNKQPQSQLIGQSPDQQTNAAMNYAKPASRQDALKAYGNKQQPNNQQTIGMQDLTQQANALGNNFLGGQ